MKKQIETSYGTLTYDDYNGKITKRTGAHIATVKDGKVTWGFVGMGWLRDEVEAWFKANANSSSKPTEKIYLQDGYYGTAADHAKGYDGIEG